jgi:hypothetical protein
MHQVTFAVQIVYCSNNTGKHRFKELFRESVPAVLVLERPEALPKRMVHETLMLAIGTFGLEAIKAGANIFPSRMDRFNRI